MVPPSLIRPRPLKHDNILRFLPRRLPALSPSRGAPRQRKARMTVCIAAVAAKSKAIVLVADKSVSYMVGDQTRQRFDVAFEKIRPMILHGWASLIAGPMDFGVRVVRLADETYAVGKADAEEASHDDYWAPYKDIPECMKIAYQSCRRVEIDDRILQPPFLGRKWYEKKIGDGTPKRDDDYFLAIEKLITDFDNESSLLLCGFEGSRPEIYTITNPGILGSESAAGFAATGIGQDTALSRLYALQTDPADSLEKVLYDAFDAKEACSQSLPDVGREEWDAFVIVGTSVSEVPAPIQRLIEQVYDAHRKSPFDTPGKAAPAKWRGRLADWASATLGGSAPASSSENLHAVG